MYTVLREAEYRSTAPIPYWNVPFLAAVVPRQQRCAEALVVVNETLDGLIDRCKQLVRLPAPAPQWSAHTGGEPGQLLTWIRHSMSVCGSRRCFIRPTLCGVLADSWFQGPSFNSEEPPPPFGSRQPSWARA